MGTIAIDNLYITKIPNSCKECPLTYLDTGDDAYFGAYERRCVIDDSCVDGMGSERAYDCPLIEAIPKANYETRLKADMVAMLTEIQMEIDEQWEITWKSDYKGGYKDGCVKANEIIQQKIDNLTEDKK